MFCSLHNLLCGNYLTRYSRMEAVIELGKQTGQLCSERCSYKTGSWLHLTWGELEDVIECSRRHHRCNDLTATIWPTAGCRCNSFYLLVMCKIQPYMQAFPDMDCGIYEWASYWLIKTLCLAVVRGEISNKLLWWVGLLWEEALDRENFRCINVFNNIHSISTDVGHATFVGIHRWRWSVSILKGRTG